MLKINFKTAASIMSLHVPKELCSELKSLHQLNNDNDQAYSSLVNLTEASIINMMHEVYLDMTSNDTPLHILPVFADCVMTFIDHNNLENLGKYLYTVHENSAEIIEELALKGIEVTYKDGTAPTNTKVTFHRSTDTPVNKVLH